MRIKYKTKLDALEVMGTFIYSENKDSYNGAVWVGNYNSKLLSPKLFIAEREGERILIRRVR